ncbi:MAG: hypothetical protein WCA50_02275 [Candidatus Sulfotelmatobacter sp.]
MTGTTGSRRATSFKNLPPKHLYAALPKGHDVAGEKALEFSADEVEEMSLALGVSTDNPAPQDDTVRGKGGGEVGKRLGEVAGFERPGGVIRWKIGNGHGPSGGYCGSGGKAFETIGVPRASSLKAV